MRLKKAIIFTAAAAMLSGVLLSSAVAGPREQSSFSALEGVEAQTLSAEEMKAISGELNAVDIGNALLKLAGNVTNPTLSAALTKLGNYYLNNKDAINAYFAKLGILTACKTC